MPIKVAVLGISAGGPPTLRIMLPALTIVGGALVLVQHIPKTFSPVLYENLRRISLCPMIQVAHATPITAGNIYYCPGGYHTRINRINGRLCACLAAPGNRDFMVPSIDQAMTSCAQTLGRRALGVVMTGMSGDGERGIRAIKAMGGRTIAQDKQSAVIFGMPRKAIETGCIDLVCNTDHIRQHVQRFLG